MALQTTAIVIFNPHLGCTSASLIASDAVPNRFEGELERLISTAVNHSIAIRLASTKSVVKDVNRDSSGPLKGYHGVWCLETGYAGLGVLIYHPNLVQSHVKETQTRPGPNLINYSIHNLYLRLSKKVTLWFFSVPVCLQCLLPHYPCPCVYDSTRRVQLPTTDEVTSSSGPC